MGRGATHVFLPPALGRMWRGSERGRAPAPVYISEEGTRNSESRFSMQAPVCRRFRPRPRPPRPRRRCCRVGQAGAWPKAHLGSCEQRRWAACAGRALVRLCCGQAELLGRVGQCERLPAGYQLVSPAAVRCHSMELRCGRALGRPTYCASSSASQPIHRPSPECRRSSGNDHGHPRAP